MRLSSEARRRLARRLVVGLAGTWPSESEQRWLHRWQPGGVILFGRNVQGASQLRELCQLLQEINPGLDIVADHEGGPISHLAAAAGQPPSPRTLGEIDDLDLTRRVHQETACRARSLGLTGILGPCADVLTEPRNPVIGVRSFGGETARVARHVAAAVAGLRDGGLEACLKHWPGHGASATDSHLEPASTEAGGQEPFLAGLKAGARGVMVGHLQYSAGDLPVTLQRARLEKWKTQFHSWAGREVQLWADDVTMGSLRPAMTRLGVAPPDGQTSGLVTPGDLPGDWLRVLSEAGCQRLLVRGIPWQALPLVDSNEPGARVISPPPAAGDTGLGPSALYREVRAIWRRNHQGSFGNPQSRLLWLDLTATDRWDQAAGDQVTARSEFARQLEEIFAQVLPAADSAEGKNGPLPDRILVTSHRPLEGRMPVSRRVSCGLAEAGVAWAWGHPSLAADLALDLGEGWDVKQSHEMDWGIFSQC